MPDFGTCPMCGDDCEKRPVDCCDAQRWDCEVAMDDYVRVCDVLGGKRCEFIPKGNDTGPSETEA